MRPPKPFSLNATEQLEGLLASSSSATERRRIQCVYLRVKYGYSAEKISEAVGLKLQTVWNIQSAYLKDGEASLKPSVRGGRRNFNLDLKAEAVFLAGFEDEGRSNGVEFKKIHAAYQKKVDKKTALSTTYRMLRCHGWRKNYPNPGFWYLPKKNVSE